MCINTSAGICSKLTVKYLAQAQLGSYQQESWEWSGNLPMLSIRITVRVTTVRR